MGRVGFHLFYCWDCCVEYAPAREGWHIYRLEDDGTAVQEVAVAQPESEGSGEGSELRCAGHSGVES